MDELLLLQGDRLLRRVPLSRGPFVVGRGAGADLALDGSGISRTHVRLAHGEEGWRVEDAGSTNGFRLNGKVVPAGRLAPGDRLEVGDYRLYLLPPAPGEAPPWDRGAGDPALEKLFLATGRSLGSADPEALLAEMLDAAMEVFAAIRGLVLVRDDHGVFAPALVRGMDADGDEAGASQTVAREVAERGHPILLANTHDPGGFAGAASLEVADARSVLCAPLVRGDLCLGVVYLDGEAASRLYTDRDLSLLSTFAAHAAGVYAAVREGARQRTRADGLRRIQEQAARDAGRDPARLVAESPAMQALQRQLDAVAQRDTTTLLLGESGTGKELLARAIHDRSPRRDGPFVAVNCMALVSDLAAAELFGHEKGAYTGAGEARPGRFELADGGTLFLDEVGELSLEMQVRLLRVLQERCVERVGGATTRAVDVRVVAATNRDMKEAIREGSFREDLWYRLNVFTLEIPPLRDRPADVVPLIEHFVDHFRAAFGKPLDPPDAAVMRILQDYAWPGNVRELRNVVERAFVLETSPRVTAGSLPPDILGAEPGAAAPGGDAAPRAFAYPRDFNRAKERFEREFFKRALVEHQGNMTAAADEAGVPRKTIYRKLKALGTTVEELLEEGRASD